MDKVNIIKGFIEGLIQGYEETEADYKVFVVASLCKVMNFITDTIEVEEND